MRIKNILFVSLILLSFFSCKKSNTVNPPIAETEESIQFSVTPNSSSSPVESTSDSLTFSIKITSKIPTAGITQNIELVRTDNQTITFSSQTNITSANFDIKIGKIELGVNYTLKINLRSRSTSTNQSATTVSITRGSNELTFSAINKTTSFYYDYMPNKYYDVLAYCLPVIQTTHPGYTTSNAHAQLDYDKDGRLDIVIQTTNFDEVAGDPILVMHNDGGGNFSIKYTFPGVEQGRRVIVNDFDGNGYLDVIVAGQAGEVPRLPNTPSQNDPSRYQNPILIKFGSGAPTATVLTDFRAINHTVAAGDINNDGKVDLLVPHFLSNMPFYAGINNGNGTFTRREIIPGINLQERTWVDLFDINSDGFLDIFLAPSGNEQTRVYLGSANGYSASSNIIFPDIPEFGITYTFQFVDFTSDGKIDVILNRVKHINNPYGSYKLQFLRNDGNSFTDVTSQHVDRATINLIGDVNNPPKWFDYLDQIDIDGDGYRDLVAGRASYDSRGMTTNLPTTYTIPLWLSNKRGGYTGATRVLTR